LGVSYLFLENIVNPEAAKLNPFFFFGLVDFAWGEIWLLQLWFASDHETSLRKQCSSLWLVHNPIQKDSLYWYAIRRIVLLHYPIC